VDLSGTCNYSQSADGKTDSKCDIALIQKFNIQEVIE